MTNTERFAAESQQRPMMMMVPVNQMGQMQMGQMQVGNAGNMKPPIKKTQMQVIQMFPAGIIQGAPQISTVKEIDIMRDAVTKAFRVAIERGLNF